MDIQYGTVTSVGKSNSHGAQLCSVKSHMSNKEYQNVEVITPKGMNYLPSIGDLVIFSEIHNSEVVVLWVLEPTDLSLANWDVVIHRWAKTKVWAQEWYNMKSRILMNPDYSISIETGDTKSGSFTPKASIKINPDGSIQVSCVSFEIL